MIGLRKTIRRMGIKPTSAGPWGQGNPKRIMNEDGGVGGIAKCGHYDIEFDKDGYCRDEDCKRNRLIEALKIGEAKMLPDGTLLWTPGMKIAEVEDGK